MIRSCLTLSDLHERLMLMGFQISRSGTYLHLLPRGSNTKGKKARTYRTRKISKTSERDAQNARRRGILHCNNQIFGISRFASGTAADHDWVVAERHKLIPSVYAGVKVEPNNFGKEEAVGYSGPTHISIRSGNTHPLQRTPMLI
ncbi:hypothetical protein EVAR_17346_1 [Eumeta japonica]|uniref:Uncharacterized protein n=1 Tax=Eumeta variegata TaxID=151549 RepID=A0A4C1WJ01_EUMVA|nr:hypothetical protein EVAR_17346_1 [Eumeta japonica]